MQEKSPEAEAVNDRVFLTTEALKASVAAALKGAEKRHAAALESAEQRHAAILEGVEARHRELEAALRHEREASSLIAEIANSTVDAGSQTEPPSPAPARKYKTIAEAQAEKRAAAERLEVLGAEASAPGVPSVPRARPVMCDASTQACSNISVMLPDAAHAKVPATDQPRREPPVTASLPIPSTSPVLVPMSVAHTVPAAAATTAVTPATVPSAAGSVIPGSAIPNTDPGSAPSARAKPVRNDKTVADVRAEKEAAKRAKAAAAASAATSANSTATAAPHAAPASAGAAPLPAAASAGQVHAAAAPAVATHTAAPKQHIPGPAGAPPAKRPLYAKLSSSSKRALYVAKGRAGVIPSHASTAQVVAVAPCSESVGATAAAQVQTDAPPVGCDAATQVTPWSQQLQPPACSASVQLHVTVVDGNASAGTVRTASADLANKVCTPCSAQLLAVLVMRVFAICAHVSYMH